jgi:hypothetical protein
MQFSGYTVCGKSAAGVILGAASDLLFVRMQRGKQIPRAEFDLGMTACGFFRKLYRRADMRDRSLPLAEITERIK